MSEEKKDWLYKPPEDEKPIQTYYLYDFTFPELLETPKPVVDLGGRLWAGRDRKSDLANESYRNQLWLAWQKSFKADKALENEKPREYFIATRHLTKPPKAGDLDIMMQKPIESVVTLAAPAGPPRFTWSPSKLSQFETCPYQFAAGAYYKTMPYQETEATRWGIRVHAAAEDYMNGKPVTDPEGFKLVEKWVKYFATIEGERFVEHKMGVDRGLKPAEWDDAEGRMILDLGVLKPDGHLILVDWKTGKQKSDETQMRIYSLIMALRFPEVQKISYRYIWVKNDAATGGELLRSELGAVAKNLLEKIGVVRTAWEHENFPQTRNGLCRAWCGVTECPHCGR